MGVPRRRTLGGFALLLAGVLPAVAGEPGAIALEDVLAFDPREAAAACGNVDYGSRMPASPAPSVSPNPDGPTLLDMYLFVLAIDQVSTASNSFRFEGYGGLIWCDPREAFDPVSSGATFHTFVGDVAFQRLGRMWEPGVLIPTALGPTDLGLPELLIFHDGTVSLRLKFHRRLSADYDFSRFPLDHQTLEIPIETSLYRSDQVVIREARGQIGLGRHVDIPEWRLEGYRVSIGKVGEFQRFLMEISIGREVGFYIWKILLPLFIISCVAWSTFWLTRDALAQRQRQSATAVLTVVAFQFIASGDLPRVAYLTVMDGIILWTYLCTGGTLLTNVLAHRRFRRAEGAGLRADRLGRVAFPLVYVGGMLIILAIGYLA
jgi:hypothetical protein